MDEEELKKAMKVYVQKGQKYIEEMKSQGIYHRMLKTFEGTKTKEIENIFINKLTSFQNGSIPLSDRELEEKKLLMLAYYLTNQDDSGKIQDIEF